MKALWIVFRKELKELFRDRRTVMTQLALAAFFGPLLVFGALKLGGERAKAQTEKALKLPVIGAQYAPNLVEYLRTKNMEIEPAPKNPEQAVLDQDFEVVLRIGDSFVQRWRAGEPAPVEIMFDSTRRDADIAVKRVESALMGYSQTLGSLRLLNRGVSTEAMTPLLMSHHDVSTPKNKAGEILGMLLPYLFIAGAFLGGAYLIIDVTAGERERQSLEPLLATPASRTAIMSGKILAACAFGALGIFLGLIGYKVVFAFVGNIGIKVELLLSTMLLVFLVLVPLLFIGACLLTLVAASVKSVKEAQSYMGFLMLVPMLPSFILMINPVKTQNWMFAVPMLSQNQLIMKLARGEAVTSVQWLIYFVTSFALAGVFGWIAARLYHRESLAISA